MCCATLQALMMQAAVTAAGGRGSQPAAGTTAAAAVLAAESIGLVNLPQRAESLVYLLLFRVEHNWLVVFSVLLRVIRATSGSCQTCPRLVSAMRIAAWLTHRPRVCSASCRCRPRSLNWTSWMEVMCCSRAFRRSPVAALCHRCLWAAHMSADATVRAARHTPGSRVHGMRAFAPSHPLSPPFSFPQAYTSVFPVHMLVTDTMAAYSSGKLKELLAGVGYSI